ncbi:preprotein translocase subunit SecE [Gallibacterium anatis]|jgi:preprotein translocase subunit SecE|uniref:Protein translocase subunit SecE n=4 Tax=Gallibacterium anatis TaxID=750 RepID=A0A0A3AJ34_9PAST|nr:preprotein translocase subunit SecE [Gallibacterium anatis]AEC17386.1 preprotein translocase subunit SecE [Gallibacterium anatis UMN179]ERF77993.1 preprotein translocase subunit SecE [Gallibacterium anatis 12656/12]KGQ24375.1 preprotein translocase subunit SecE [Gallibacterium anatis]KGQ24595.1 preprotein translocase subunit SecE [Gallibacterium anatis]KGQ24851.1 preprotein translocase subunit SecE [Gallibacterium anatis CCM5995]
MSVEIEKKKASASSSVEDGLKSKGLNSTLWIICVILVLIAAVGNIYFGDQFSSVVRVPAMVVLLLLALFVAAITNQGTVARTFLKESRIELRKIIWPTRQEATQTTLVVMGVTVVVSLILWGLDSIIVSLINFITNLRF